MPQAPRLVPWEQRRQIVLGDVRLRAFTDQARHPPERPHTKDIRRQQRALRVPRLRFMRPILLRQLGSATFERKRSEPAEQDAGLEEEHEAVSGEVGEVERAGPEEEARGVERPEEEDERGGGAGAGMVEVGENGRDGEGYGLEDVELEEGDGAVSEEDEDEGRDARA